MSSQNYANMTIEELEHKISENNKSMISLQEKIDKSKQSKSIEFDKVMNLLSEITNTKKIYYDYRSILGNSILLGLTEAEFDSIEVMMPIYEQKIKLLEKKLKDIDFTTIL